MERRLHLSVSRAYQLINVHERFAGQSFQELETLQREVLFLLAAPSTPSPIVATLIEKVEAGETVTLDEARRMVEDAKAEVLAAQPTLDLDAERGKIREELLDEWEPALQEARRDEQRKAIAPAAPARPSGPRRSA